MTDLSPTDTQTIQAIDGAPAIDALPDVQEHALNAARVKRGGVAADAAESGVTINPSPETSAPNGEQWDPALHETPPRLSTRGGWAKLRGGVRGGRSVAKQPKVKDAQSSTPEQDQAALAARAAAAKMAMQAEENKIKGTAATCTYAFFAGGQAVAGECFKPQEGEEELLTNAFADYMRASGIIDIPPGVGLMMAAAMIIAKRWSHPSFVERRKGWMAIIPKKRGGSDE